ncbi:FUN14 domain-containing protein 1B-like [Coccinella septempunctata]|uniref:FUN14 domain-containing protein 1B-like n=1 Tax=Coccinella septempunctata TaxID=41139 RepID=UPI001D075847|nr:FUN14 domain-containing protein 1B-like [Coccinella septempunctata]
MPTLNNLERVVENIVLPENGNKGVLGKILDEISKTTPTKQMIIGVSSGWVSGFLAMKIGKTTAMALGGGIILLQVASEKGFIKINWDKVNENIDKVEDIVSQEQLTWVDKIAKFAEKNSTFSSGFLGGFLIGLASH